MDGRVWVLVQIDLPVLLEITPRRNLGKGFGAGLTFGPTWERPRAPRQSTSAAAWLQEAGPIASPSPFARWLCGLPLVPRPAWRRTWWRLHDLRDLVPLGLFSRFCMVMMLSVIEPSGIRPCASWWLGGSARRVMSLPGGKMKSGSKIGNQHFSHVQKNHKTGF